MSRERLYLFDTTLRDGAQTNGVDFTLHDKQLIAQMLDDLGIDYVEGGYPGANPTDSEFFATKPKLDHARFTAFGMTRRPGRSVSNDPGLAGLLEAKADAICFVAKSSAYQVRVALETTNEENLASIRDSVGAAKAAGREVMLDCEHFFDGYKENPEFALACARAAYDFGARWVVLCDTNGGTMPHEVETIVGEVIKQIPGDHVGIHAHNDTDQAVANSLAAVRAGVRQIQGTLNGLGERCGNANLCSLIPTLRLKRSFPIAFEIAVSPDKMATLMKVSRTLDDMLNRAPDRHAPYVGESAFVTKTGIHASAVLKDPQTYEHVPPETVGNHRKVLVSDQAGAFQRDRRTRARRHLLRQERSEAGPSGRGIERARGCRLRLRIRQRVVRPAGAAHARPGAGIFPGRAIRCQCRAALQRQRPARDGGDGGGEGRCRRGAI